MSLNWHVYDAYSPLLIVFCNSEYVLYVVHWLHIKCCSGSLYSPSLIVTTIVTNLYQAVVFPILKANTLTDKDRRLDETSDWWTDSPPVEKVISLPINEKLAASQFATLLSDTNWVTWGSGMVQETYIYDDRIGDNPNPVCVRRNQINGW